MVVYKVADVNVYIPSGEYVGVSFSTVAVWSPLVVVPSVTYMYMYLTVWPPAKGCVYTAFPPLKLCMWPPNSCWVVNELVFLLHSI